MSLSDWAVYAGLNIDDLYIDPEAVELRTKISSYYDRRSFYNDDSKEWMFFYSMTDDFGTRNYHKISICPIKFSKNFGVIKVNTIYGLGCHTESTSYIKNCPLIKVLDRNFIREMEDFPRYNSDIYKGNCYDLSLVNL